MDLSKAFDTVDHTILLYKLESAGVQGIVHKLFKSYLKDRFIVASVNGKLKGERQRINLSVSQGSVLGPLLSLSYINDMSALDLRGKFRLFADDSADFFESISYEINVDYMKRDLALVAAQ